MTQRQVLGDEICAPFKDDCNHGKNQRELDGHPAKDTLIPFLTKKFSDYAAVCNIDEAHA